MQNSEIKLQLFQYIDNLEGIELQKLYDLLFPKYKKKEIDFWNTLSQWQKTDIELGISNLKNGKKQNFDDFIQKYQ